MRKRKDHDERPGSAHGKAAKAEGMVSAAYARRCRVWWEDREWDCAVGARLLREGPLVAGDRVTFRPAEKGLGSVEIRHPRRTVLVRLHSGRERPPRGRPAAPLPAQVLAANVDLLVVVASIREPPFRTGLVERILVAGAKAGLATRIQITKIDLDRDGAAEDLTAQYRNLGIPVSSSDLHRPETLAPLKAALADRINILVGHSGVGKTSLLNAIAGTDLAVGRVADRRRRGRHTTSTAQLIPLPGGGLVIDSPGIREFGLHGIAPADLARYFPGLTPLLTGCAFRNCLHHTEGGCAVREAVARGDYAADRYEGYLKLLAELEGE